MSHLLQDFQRVSNRFGTLCIKGLKKLYEICTDDYDNNEYLVVKYTRFFTNDII